MYTTNGSLPLLDYFIAFVVSFFAGLIGAMVGVGGGIVNGPFLTFLNYLPSQISSTSLLSVISTSISSSTQYAKRKLINYRVGVVLAASSIPGTVIGVYLSNLISMEQFRYYFGVILASTAIYLLLRKNMINSRSIVDSGLDTFQTKSKTMLMILLSFFAGIISSTFGVGGGIIYVPSLVIFMRFNMKSSTATSQFALIFTSISGVLMFASQGWPDYNMGIVLSLGSLFGGTAGSLLALRINSSKILILFSIVLLLVSGKVFFDGFFGA